MNYCNDCGGALNMRPCRSCDAIVPACLKHCPACGREFEVKPIIEVTIPWASRVGELHASSSTDASALSLSPAAHEFQAGAVEAFALGHANESSQQADGTAHRTEQTMLLPIEERSCEGPWFENDLPVFDNPAETTGITRDLEIQPWPLHATDEHKTVRDAPHQVRRYLHLLTLAVGAVLFGVASISLLNLSSVTRWVAREEVGLIASPPTPAGGTHPFVFSDTTADRVEERTTKLPPGTPRDEESLSTTDISQSGEPPALDQEKMKGSSFTESQTIGSDERPTVYSPVPSQAEDGLQQARQTGGEGLTRIEPQTANNAESLAVHAQPAAGESVGLSDPAPAGKPPADGASRNVETESSNPLQSTNQIQLAPGPHSLEIAVDAQAAELELEPPPSPEVDDPLPQAHSGVPITASKEQHSAHPNVVAPEDLRPAEAPTNQPSGSDATSKEDCRAELRALNLCGKVLQTR